MESTISGLIFPRPAASSYNFNTAADEGFPEAQLIHIRRRNTRKFTYGYYVSQTIRYRKAVTAWERECEAIIAANARDQNNNGSDDALNSSNDQHNANTSSNLVLPAKPAYPYSVAAATTNPRHSLAPPSPPTPPRYLILYAHPNAVDIGGILDEACALSHAIGNVDVLVWEYRGYGMCDGAASERELYLDMEAVFDFVETQLGIPSHQVILAGRSIGSGPSVQLAGCLPTVLNAQRLARQRAEEARIDREGTLRPDSLPLYRFDSFGIPTQFGADEKEERDVEGGGAVGEEGRRCNFSSLFATTASSPPRHRLPFAGLFLQGAFTSICDAVDSLIDAYTGTGVLAYTTGITKTIAKKVVAERFPSVRVLPEVFAFETTPHVKKGASSGDGASSPSASQQFEMNRNQIALARQAWADTVQNYLSPPFFAIQHGDQDEIIPHSHAKALMAAIDERCSPAARANSSPTSSYKIMFRGNSIANLRTAKDYGHNNLSIEEAAHIIYNDIIQPHTQMTEVLQGAYRHNEAFLKLLEFPPPVFVDLVAVVDKLLDCYSAGCVSTEVAVRNYRDDVRRGMMGGQKGVVGEDVSAMNATAPAVASFFRTVYSSQGPIVQLAGNAEGAKGNSVAAVPGVTALAFSTAATHVRHVPTAPQQNSTTALLATEDPRETSHNAYASECEAEDATSVVNRSTTIRSVVPSSDAEGFNPMGFTNMAKALTGVVGAGGNEDAARKSPSSPECPPLTLERWTRDVLPKRMRPLGSILLGFASIGDDKERRSATSAALYIPRSVSPTSITAADERNVASPIRGPALPYHVVDGVGADATANTTSPIHPIHPPALLCDPALQHEFASVLTASIATFVQHVAMRWLRMKAKRDLVQLRLRGASTSAYGYGGGVGASTVQSSLLIGAGNTAPGAVPPTALPPQQSHREFIYEHLSLFGSPFGAYLLPVIKGKDSNMNGGVATSRAEQEAQEKHAKKEQKRQSRQSNADSEAAASSSSPFSGAAAGNYSSSGFHAVLFGNYIADPASLTAMEALAEHLGESGGAMLSRHTPLKCWYTHTVALSDAEENNNKAPLQSASASSLPAPTSPSSAPPPSTTARRMKRMVERFPKIPIFELEVPENILTTIERFLNTLDHKVALGEIGGGGSAAPALYRPFPSTHASTSSSSDGAASSSSLSSSPHPSVLHVQAHDEFLLNGERHLDDLCGAMSVGNSLMLLSESDVDRIEAECERLVIALVQREVSVIKKRLLLAAAAGGDDDVSTSAAMEDVTTKSMPLTTLLVPFINLLATRPPDARRVPAMRMVTGEDGDDIDSVEDDDDDDDDAGDGDEEGYLLPYLYGPSEFIRATRMLLPPTSIVRLYKTFSHDFYNTVGDLPSTLAAVKQRRHWYEQHHPMYAVRLGQPSLEVASSAPPNNAMTTSTPSASSPSPSPHSPPSSHRLLVSLEECMDGLIFDLQSAILRNVPEGYCGSVGCGRYRDADEAVCLLQELSLKTFVEAETYKLPFSPRIGEKLKRRVVEALEAEKLKKATARAKESDNEARGHTSINSDFEDSGLNQSTASLSQTPEEGGIVGLNGNCRFISSPVGGSDSARRNVLLGLCENADELARDALHWIMPPANICSAAATQSNNDCVIM